MTNNLMDILTGSVSVTPQIVTHIYEGAIWYPVIPKSYESYLTDLPELTQKVRPLYILSIVGNMVTCLKTKTVHLLDSEKKDPNTIIFNDGEALRAVILNEPITIPLSCFKHPNAQYKETLIPSLRDAIKSAYAIRNKLSPDPNIYSEIIKKYLCKTHKNVSTTHSSDTPVKEIKPEDLFILPDPEDEQGSTVSMKHSEEFNLQDIFERIESSFTEDVKKKMKKVIDDLDRNKISESEAEKKINEIIKASAPIEIKDAVSDVLNSISSMSIVSVNEILSSTPQKLSEKYQITENEATTLITNFDILKRIDKRASSLSIAADSERFNPSIHDGFMINTSTGCKMYAVKAHIFKDLFNFAKNSNDRYANVTYSTFTKWISSFTSLNGEWTSDKLNSTYGMKVFPQDIGNVGVPAKKLISNK